MNIVLALINLICAIMHGLYEGYLYNQEGKYIQFILIENMMITILFLVLAVTTVRYEIASLKLNLLFWVVFEVCVIAFKPENTTLDMIESLLPASQWVVLGGFGGVTIMITIIAISGLKRKKHERKILYRD